MSFATSFLVDVIDNSMSPRLRKGDYVTVLSGFEVDENHIAAVLVTDDVAQTTHLYLRKVVVEHDRVILAPANLSYPTMIFEGEEIENVRIVGVVSQLHRVFDRYNRPHFPMTAKRAVNNRLALEKQTGNIECEPVEEEPRQVMTMNDVVALFSKAKKG